jgi:hypothetical protein
MPEMMGARAGGRDNIVFCIFEDFNSMLCNRARVPAQAGVELRLSTAGLFAGEVHVNAEAVKDVYYRLPSSREERIGEAGDEDLNDGHVSILSHSRIPNRFDPSKLLERLPELA